MQDDYNHVRSRVNAYLLQNQICLYRCCCKSASVTSAVTCVQLRHRNQSSRLIRPGTCKPDSAHCRHLLRTCACGGDDLLVLSITPVCMEEAWQTARPLTRISRRHRQVPAQSMSVISGTPARRTWPTQVHVCLQYSHEACPHNMVNFGPLAAEIVSLVWGTPGNFNGFRVLAALLHGI